MRAWLRRRPLTALLVPAVLMLVVGLAAGRFVTSPAQVAADAAPPEPTVLTASVEFGTVASTQASDAEIRATGTMTVFPAPPSGEDKAVVSAIHVLRGDKVEAGDALVDVAGRPTFVMKGQIAAYRTLGPGMSGPDVAQLQSGLRSAGYSIPSSEGSFSSSTKSAVEAFYRDRGYPVLLVGKDEVEAATESARSAERSLAAANRTLTRARRDFDRATATPDAGVPMPNRDGIEDATVARDEAREDLTRAAQSLAEARRAAGPQVRLGEVVFVKKLPAEVVQVDLKAGANVGDGAIKLAAGEISAVAQFQTPQTELMEKGNPATIFTDDGTQLEGSVASMRDLGNRDGGEVTEVVVKPGKPFKRSLLGSDVRINVEVTRSAAKTLMVPEAAIVTGADGTSRVRVQDVSGEFRDVDVIVGADGDGMVGVTAHQGAQLSEGEQVVIGIVS